MKQYAMRTTERTSFDIALHKVPCCRRTLNQENANTYMHKVVDEVIKPMKYG
jgi:hypothetical protein